MASPTATGPIFGGSRRVCFTLATAFLAGRRSRLFARTASLICSVRSATPTSARLRLFRELFRLMQRSRHPDGLIFLLAGRRRWAGLCLRRTRLLSLGRKAQLFRNGLPMFALTTSVWVDHSNSLLLPGRRVANPLLSLS
jgi:hypothetical protein